ncbi:MAG: helix-turn-helix transcriptional regulator, partial [Kiritimatiellae bacterium]|nr:helix-turn-helix transcriptional regulator [Kiritimatiellia bacterium]
DVFGIALDADVPMEEPRPKPTKSKSKTARPRSGVPGKTIAVEASDAVGDSDGGLMRTVRLRLGLSQAEMGQRFGTYQAIISQIERGKARLRPGWAERLREMELHGK